MSKEFPTYVEDKKEKPKVEPNKIYICKIEPEEVEGKKYTEKRGGYHEWANAIAEKYNLTRNDFEVEDDGRLYYLEWPVVTEAPKQNENP